MGIFQDITGQRFSKLIAIRRVENTKDGCAQYLCKCDCGGERIVKATNLRRGVVKHCGCENRITNKKASNEQLIQSYKRTNNVWETAKELGMCGQSVHERLVRLNVINKINVFSEEDYLKLKEFYQTHELKKGSNELEIIAKELGRTKQFISRKAKELGLTSYNRKDSKEMKKAKSKRIKKWHKTHEHPKGMQGKHHTKEVLEKLKAANKRYFENLTEEEKLKRTKKILKSRFKNKTTNARKNVSWKGGHRKIGNKKIYFRSSWEYNYALYLQYLKRTKKIKKWEYEAELFYFEGIKRGCVSYKPDFRVTRNDDSVYYVEIKGWMDAASKTKLKRMAKYYPEIELVLIDSPKYKAFKKEWQDKLKNWEK